MPYFSKTRTIPVDLGRHVIDMKRQPKTVSKRPRRLERPERARIAIDNPYEEPSFPLGIVRRGDPAHAVMRPNISGMRLSAQADYLALKDVQKN